MDHFGLNKTRKNTQLSPPSLYRRRCRRRRRRKKHICSADPFFRPMYVTSLCTSICTQISYKSHQSYRCHRQRKATAELTGGAAEGGGCLR